MLETNLLRSVGGIHLAVIGWIAGQVAPCVAALSVTNNRDESEEGKQKTYQHESENRSENGDCDVTVSRGQRSEKRYSAGYQHTVSEYSLGTHDFREPSTW